MTAETIPTRNAPAAPVIPQRAIVLSAGLGTRMRHLSQDRPKPLTPLAGRTMLDRALDRLGDAGVDTAVVNVHYMADKIEAALADRTQPRVLISDERDARLETGGGVVRALPLLGTAPFFVHNADCCWRDGVGDNLRTMAAAWDSDRMDVLLLLAPIADSLGYEGRGDFHLDPHGCLRRRGEREDAPFVFTGVSIAHPRLFHGAPEGAFSLNVVWDRAIAANRAYGVRMSGLWMHIGTPEALEEAEALMRNEPETDHH